MTYRRLSAALALAALVALAADAAPSSGSPAAEIKGVAVGAFLGQPTGLTCRLGLGGRQSSIEAKAAWDLAGSKDKAAAFTFQANYLVEFPGVLVLEGHDVPPYLGGGAELDIGAETRVGFRIPVGLVYRLKSAPVEFCLEIGLGLGLFPSTSPMFSGGIGVRYILKGGK